MLASVTMKLSAVVREQVRPGMARTQVCVREQMCRAAGPNCGCDVCWDDVCCAQGTKQFPGITTVHTHATNTRITDVEILEKRYPILLRQFAIRRGSGGRGKFRGGDGVVREFEFLEDMTFGILSERRVFTPYGMHGGEPGANGKNVLIKRVGGKPQQGHPGNGNGDDGDEWLTYNLGSRNAISVAVGDRVVIMTPGGGAWGSVEESA